MKRTILILVGLWATLVGPSLCLAGVLTHSCEPHPASDCSHESACSEDPCGQIIKTQGDTPAITLHLEVSPVLPAGLVDFELPAESHCVGDIEPPRTFRLPFPRSDIPLRV